MPTPLPTYWQIPSPSVKGISTHSVAQVQILSGILDSCFQHTPHQFIHWSFWPQTYLHFLLSTAPVPPQATVNLQQANASIHANWSIPSSEYSLQRGMVILKRYSQNISLPGLSSYKRVIIKCKKISNCHNSPWNTLESGHWILPHFPCYLPFHVVISFHQHTPRMPLSLLSVPADRSLPLVLFRPLLHVLSSDRFCVMLITFSFL